ncbi:MAG: PAS domain-containing protein [Deltaproteobacteria bacterium]|nr:PAS domain-containing protein [Deltaproteobacteria bacterium]
MQKRSAEGAAAAGNGPAGDGGQQQRLETLLARAPGLLWSTDAELRCEVVGGSAATQVVIAVGDAVADTPLAGIEGAGTAAHRHALAGESVRYEIHAGEAVFSGLVEPWRAPDGRIVGVMGSAEDVTLQRRAASVLATQQSVFETMLDQSLVGIGICAADGRFLFVNATLRRVAEEDPTDQAMPAAQRVWGRWCADGALLPVDDWPLARALRGELIEAREMYRDRPDGGRDYLLVSGAPVRAADGTLLGAVVTTADITRRKQMEEETRALNEALEQRVRDRTRELQRAQQTLIDFLDHSTAVIYLKDRDSRYLRVNRHYERLFGVTNDAVVGQRADDMFPPEVADALRHNDQQVLAHGRSLHIEEVVPTAGEPRTYLSVKFPLRDPRGDVYGVCGISTDITELKRAEAELRRSQATLTAVIDSSPDPIWAVDASINLLAFNAAAARFIEDVIGLTPSREARLKPAVPPDILTRWLVFLQRVLNGERFTVEESITVRGVPRRLLVSLTPMLEDGRVTGAAAFTKDITELMRAEEQARQHQAELAHVLRLHTMGEMAASLAHEVNQPLGAIANFAQGVRRRLDAGGIEPAELHRSVEAIAREALRAGEITRRVRHLLRKEDAPRLPVDLNEIVGCALRVAEPTARQRRVALQTQVAALPAVLADAIQIEQVLCNLILNGIEAIPAADQTRRVEIETRATGSGVEVVVRDSGIGIDAQRATDIFQPFLTTKPGGLGMGLAISRSIIEAHGGRLWATSAPGGGAALHFTLPAASD